MNTSNTAASSLQLRRQHSDDAVQNKCLGKLICCHKVSSLTSETNGGAGGADAEAEVRKLYREVRSKLYREVRMEKGLKRFLQLHPQLHTLHYSHALTLIPVACLGSLHIRWLLKRHIFCYLAAPPRGQRACNFTSKPGWVLYVSVAKLGNRLQDLIKSTFPLPAHL